MAVNTNDGLRRIGMLVVLSVGAKDLLVKNTNKGGRKYFSMLSTRCKVYAPAY